MRSTRSKVTGWLVLITLLCAVLTGQSSAAAAEGPLRVHPDNPRHFTDGTGKLSKQVELYRWVDFSMEAPGAADGLARWDVEGSCLWTHKSGAQRTSLLWYSGSGDNYVYRFGGSFQGHWTGTTTSPVPKLDGLTLTVDVMPSGNPNRIGGAGKQRTNPPPGLIRRGPTERWSSARPS